MPAQRTLLIEKAFSRTLADRAGSLRTGHPRTGSGRRQNYTLLLPAGCEIPILLQETQRRFVRIRRQRHLLQKMGGGSVGATGQFNFSVEEAYLIENGLLTKPLKGAILIGEAEEIMNKISMCSKDLALAAGFCGSISGSIYTTGQPHIKVDSITVGGR